MGQNSDRTVSQNGTMYRKRENRCRFAQKDFWKDIQETNNIGCLWGEEIENLWV